MVFPLALLTLVVSQERKLGMDQLAIAPSALAEMISLIEDTTISGKIAKDILPELLEGKGNAGVKVRGWRAMQASRCGEEGNAGGVKLLSLPPTLDLSGVLVEVSLSP